MSLCIVTAFLDISRDSWTTFQRSVDQYITNFLRYKILSHEIIVFIDNKYFSRLESLTQNFLNIKLIPIDRDFMKTHLYSYNQLQREQEIMGSEKFKELVKHRLKHPECSKPEYNIIQHCKIDFVCHVINNDLTQAEYLCWSDFGYFQHPSLVPSSDLDLTKFNLEKVNFVCVDWLRKEDSNIMYTLTQAPPRVEGGFFLGRRDKLLEYQQLYHKVYNYFHSIGIVDDDQHIILQCYFRDTTKFNLLVIPARSSTFLYFQKNSQLLNCGTLLMKAN